MRGGVKHEVPFALHRRHALQLLWVLFERLQRLLPPQHNSAQCSRPVVTVLLGV